MHLNLLKKSSSEMCDVVHNSLENRDEKHDEKKCVTKRVLSSAPLDALSHLCCALLKATSKV